MAALARVLQDAGEGGVVKRQGFLVVKFTFS